MSRRRVTLTKAPRGAKSVQRPHETRRPGAAAPTTRSRVERPRRDRRRLRRLTKWLLVTGVVVTALTFGAQWTLRQSYFRVQHVTFVGFHHETPSELLAASGLAKHPSMINLSDTTIKKNLSAFTWIGAVQVTKHWPNSVVVTVHESSAVAVAFTSTHVLEFVDQRGRALGVAPLKTNMPTLEYVHPLSSTWPFSRAGRAAAYVASQLPRAFASQVSTVSVNAQGAVTIKLTTPVTFILGPATNLHAKFVAIASVIAHSPLVPGDVVDVTVPDELAVTPPTHA
jgi:cell division protein FtsQ